MFFKHLISKKIKQLSVGELLYYANEYGFSITEYEAMEIINFIQNNEIDPFSKEGRMHLYEQLKNITNETTATKAYHLFHELIENYGLTNYFE